MPIYSDKLLDVFVRIDHLGRLYVTDQGRLRMVS